jgi:hypothetical protein
MVIHVRNTRWEEGRGLTPTRVGVGVGAHDKGWVVVMVVVLRMSEMIRRGCGLEERGTLTGM